MEQVESPAGFWVRLGANILDGILAFLILGTLSLIIYGSFDYTNYLPLNLIDLLYVFLLPILWYGYTVGKRVCGIRIIKLDGSNVGVLTMFLRLIIAGILYALTLGIALIVSACMVGIREDKRAIHDFIAGTYVTRIPPEQS